MHRAWIGEESAALMKRVFHGSDAHRVQSIDCCFDAPARTLTVENDFVEFSIRSSTPKKGTAIKS